MMEVTKHARHGQIGNLGLLCLSAASFVKSVVKLVGVLVELFGTIHQEVEQRSRPSRSTKDETNAAMCSRYVSAEHSWSVAIWGTLRRLTEGFYDTASLLSLIHI